MTDHAFTLFLAPAARQRIGQDPPIGLRLAAAEAVTAFLVGPLLDDPYRVGTPLRRELAAYHAARRGPYRVVYRIVERTQDEERVVRVLRIDHQADRCAHI